MGEAKLGSQNIGKIFLGSQQLGGGVNAVWEYSREHGKSLIVNTVH